MPRMFVVIALLVACGGETTDGPTTTDETEVEFDQSLCEFPYFDLDGMNCDQIESAFTQTVGFAEDCNRSEDCQVISGNCESGGFTAAGCWYAVNMCDQSPPGYPDVQPSYGWVEVGRFQRAWRAGSCEQPNTGCSGCDARPDVDCIEGKCTLL
ncbi:MAG: hypothetical protein KTR31_23880 [Myxococcales bacterium]|nr:hypothetical protein [Myxococcales bacterium]